MEYTLEESSFQEEVPYPRRPYQNKLACFKDLHRDAWNFFEQIRVERKLRSIIQIPELDECNEWIAASSLFDHHVREQRKRKQEWLQVSNRDIPIDQIVERAREQRSAFIRVFGPGTGALTGETIFVRETPVHDDQSFSAFLDRSLEVVLREKKEEEEEAAPGCTKYPTEEQAKQDVECKEEEEGRACVLCNTFIACCVAVPCGHHNFCASCSRTICKNERRRKLVECPLCRRETTQFLKTFS